MKKVIKRVFFIVLCVAISLVCVRFAPNIYERLFGNSNTKWISEHFSETLKEKNELVVYEVETTGQETVSQDAWLIGTVQKVEIPYTFSMSFTVDLSSAEVTLTDNTITLRVPSPKPAYPKLTVDETKVKRTDWLYPLTPERYSAMKTQIEDRLFSECSNNEQYTISAWGVTQSNLQSLFRSVAERSELGVTCEIEIVQYTPAPQPTTPNTTDAGSVTDV
ncbi:MAG: DUF4230 domain-containing protein [Clostridiales bacterium]|nr:DUF4230 domain-containing protein [Clostridiales bacterium]